MVNFVGQVVNGMAAKLSPVQLTYSLMHCKMMTLNGKSGIGQLGVPAYRPSNLVLTFGEDVPAAAADATLWVHAHIQNHRLHVRDMIGVPNGAPRGFSGILDTDAGQPYDVELLRARDPLIKDKYAQRYWPHIGAIRVRVGDTGQSIDWMFLKGSLSSCTLPQPFPHLAHLLASLIPVLVYVVCVLMSLLFCKC